MTKILLDKEIILDILYRNLHFNTSCEFLKTIEKHNILAILQISSIIDIQTNIEEIVNQKQLNELIKDLSKLFNIVGINENDFFETLKNKSDTSNKTQLVIDKYNINAIVSRDKREEYKKTRLTIFSPLEFSKIIN